MTTYQHHTRIVVGVFCLFLMVAWMGGCSQNKDLKDVQDPFYEQWRVRAEESKGNSAVKPPPVDEKPYEIVSKEIFEEVQPEVQKPLPNRKVSLNMKKIEVAVLLRALAKAADQNIILNEKIVGKMDINIHQAPWDQVFMGILRAQGLSYAWEGNIIRVMTSEDMDADLKSRARQRELKLAQPPLTRIVAVKFSEADKLKANLEKFVTPDKSGKQTGSILVDEHTNSLIIQAVQNDMDRILAIIKKLDRPTPQVLIEAHIVEASKAVARELGVQWGGIYAGKRGNTEISVTGPQTLTGTTSGTDGVSINEPLNVTSGSVVNLPAMGLGGFDPTTLGIVAANMGDFILSVQLSALQDQGKLNILSSPSITTLDNQTALIESGADIPFQSVEDGEVKVEYKKAVISLKVIPHVIDGQTLKMYVNVSKDEPNFAQTVLGNPTIITRNAETNVIQNDGQTIVIGGLSSQTGTRSRTGTPFLEDIPGLGYLFKRKSSSDEMEELLIFITPHILKPKAVGGRL
ncbi:MAG: type IV pilus secretin PilQ [Desulfobacterales bacterium]|nr:type IV pilus secretin PilQ [Desulfobacterales bacterium]